MRFIKDITHSLLSLSVVLSFVNLRHLAQIILSSLPKCRIPRSLLTTFLHIVFGLFHVLYKSFTYFLLRRGKGAEYCDQHVCLCVCVCLSVREHISGTAGPIGTKFCVQIPCGRGSVLLQRRYATVCTSGFMDDVTFGRNGRDAERWRRHSATAINDMAIPGLSLMSMNTCCVLEIIHGLLSVQDQITILEHKFQEGWKLEALDQCLPSIIRPATVIRVINKQYFIVELDDRSTSDERRPGNQLCCHAGSLNIFPVGWCSANNIRLAPVPGTLLLMFSAPVKLFKLRCIFGEPCDMICVKASYSLKN